MMDILTAPATAAEQMAAKCPRMKGVKSDAALARRALIARGVKKPTQEQMAELGGLLFRHRNANPTKPVPTIGIAQEYLKGKG